MQRKGLSKGDNLRSPKNVVNWNINVKPSCIRSMPGVLDQRVVQQPKGGGHSGPQAKKQVARERDTTYTDRHRN